MNPNKSKDFKLTQSTEEVVERINTLHGYVPNTLAVQLRHTQFNVQVDTQIPR